MKFPFKDLVTFTDKILNWKFQFFVQGYQKFEGKIDLTFALIYAHRFHRFCNIISRTWFAD